jgi:hypothetical protein
MTREVITMTWRHAKEEKQRHSQPAARVGVEEIDAVMIEAVALARGTQHGNEKQGEM